MATRTQMKKTEITRQIMALDNPEFIITAVRPVLDESGNQTYAPVVNKESGESILDDQGQPIMEPVIEKRNLCKKTGNWRLADVLEDKNLKYMEFLNADGFAIYITPQEEIGKSICILVDDIKPSLIETYGPPNLLIQSSPKSQQAVYVLPYVHNRDVYLQIFNYLNLKHGDDKINALRHPFRLAEFTNRKQKYQQPDGSFPYVKIKSARKTLVPEQLIAFVDECAAGKFPIHAEVKHLRGIVKGKIESDTPAPSETSDSCEAPAPSQRRTVIGGSGPDFRGDDFSAALKAAWSGMEGQELRDYIEETSDHIKAPCGYDRELSVYVEKTAKNAEEKVEKAKEAKEGFDPWKQKNAAQQRKLRDRMRQKAQQKRKAVARPGPRP